MSEPTETCGAMLVPFLSCERAPGHPGKHRATWEERETTCSWSMTPDRTTQAPKPKEGS